MGCDSTVVLSVYRADYLKPVGTEALVGELLDRLADATVVPFDRVRITKRQCHYVEVHDEEADEWVRIPTEGGGRGG